MFLLIAKYDWLLLKANKLLLWVTASMLFIAAFALYEGYQRVSFQKNTIEAIAKQQKADYAKYRRQIATAKPGQHFDGGHYGDPTNPFYFGNRMGAQYAVLPPAPLAVLSGGQSDIYPYYYKVTLSKKQALYHNEELENPQVLYNGRFDLSFVIIYLLPLLIIAFTYNIYATEKENGTLLLLLAQNTSVQKVTGFRFLFRYLLFTIFFNLVLFSGLFAAGVAPQQVGNAIAKLFSLCALYIAFWFGLSYVVAALKKTAGFNATVLTGAWLLIVLLIPAVLNVLVNELHPMPSRLELITKTRAISDSVAKSSNVLNRFLEEHPEFKPAVADAKDRNPVTLRNRIETELAMEKIMSNFEHIAEKRTTLVTRYRFLSPAIVMQDLLNEAAGTHEQRYKDFSKSVERYQQRFRNYFEPLVYKQVKFTVKDLDSVPAFNFSGNTHVSLLADNYLLGEE